MQGRTPTAEEDRHMKKVVQLGCICCRLDMGVFSPAEIHHLRGKTEDGAHFDVIPLCPAHHRYGNDNSLYTSRHPYKARFEQRYGSEQCLKQKTDKLLAIKHQGSK